MNRTEDIPNEFEVSHREGYEVRDVNPKRLMWIGIGLVLVLMGSALTAWGVLTEFAATTSPLRSTKLWHEQAPTPGVHPNQAYQRVHREARQRKRLESYGWEDKSKEVVHIPIHVAMRHLQEHGFEVDWSSHPSSSQSEPTSDASDASKAR